MTLGTLIDISTIDPDKFYLYNVIDKTIHDGPFNDVEYAWDTCQQRYIIDLIHFSNPYSIWKGSSIISYVDKQWIEPDIESPIAF